MSTHSDKAARCGEPSYVWRAGQQRRLQMILDAADSVAAIGDGGQPPAPPGSPIPATGHPATRPLLSGHVLENGCGVGMYVEKLAEHAARVTGLEYEFDRAQQAAHTVAALPNARIVNAAGEYLPFPDETFSLILSHEVLEHVQDDRLAAAEMARVLKPGGRIVVFVPNRGYPFETHGIYWRGAYRFGNIPLVNYLPRRLRDRLAPHVRVYSTRDLEQLFAGLPLQLIERTVIFGAYDNIIARRPALGKLLRAALHALEGSPLRALGLSHVWVLEKAEGEKV